MNYIIEIKEFYDWLETNELTAAAINLWNALMHTANRAKWPDNFSVSTATLISKTGLSQNSIYKARLLLKEKGRITFTNPNKKKSSIYTIIPFSILTDTAIIEAIPACTDPCKIIKDSEATTSEVIIENQMPETIDELPKKEDELASIITQSATKTAPLSKEKRAANERLCEEVISYLNQKSGKNFKAKSDSSKRPIIARLNEGFSLEDFKLVIDIKTSVWGKEPRFGEQDMRPYIRPETLFGNKFDSYLNEKQGGNVTNGTLSKKQRELAAAGINFSQYSLG